MADFSTSLSNAAHPSPDEWIDRLARFGYATKGVVYVVIGVMAVKAAIGSGGATEGTRGAILEMADEPFGQVLLALTAVGLFGYAVWRFVAAFYDPEGEGRDAKGKAKRIAYLVSALAYLGLAFWAASILFGWNSGSGSGGAQQSWTARLMAQPFGPWLVGLIGAIVIAVGLYRIREAYQARFMDKYRTGRMSPEEKKWARHIGRFGIAARSVVFCIIGIFLIQAALQHDPSETRGLGGALQSLANQPFGTWLLGLVAAGLVAYGLYCFSRARYSRFSRR